MRNDGGPAFPSLVMLSGPNGDRSAMMGGMSLRDYFAIEAAKPMIASALERGMGRGDPEKLAGVINVGIPPEAYKFADAMLTERDRP